MKKIHVLIILYTCIFIYMHAKNKYFWKIEEQEGLKLYLNSDIIYFIQKFFVTKII